MDCNFTENIFKKRNRYYRIVGFNREKNSVKVYDCSFMKDNIDYSKGNWKEVYVFFEFDLYDEFKLKLIKEEIEIMIKKYPEIII